MILPELNPAQREAVNSRAPWLAIVAGPGTGKTRVLTERIVHFIQERGAHPSEILAITFTNQAAGEMKERIVSSLGRIVDEVHAGNPPQISTFHQWGYRFLRDAGHSLAPVDNEGAKLLFKEAAQRVNWPARERAAAFQAIQAARQRWPITMEDPDLARLMEEYLQILRGYGLWDYDDLILEPIRLLEHGSGHPDTPRFIFVDEFQDVSPAQFSLIRLLSGKRPDAELTVIGDPNQSIYGFRGASPSFMEEFHLWFPNAEVVRLNTAYRCPQRFIDGALQVLEESTQLLSCRGTGPKIEIREFRSPSSEAKWVAETIERLLGGLNFESARAGPDAADSFSDFAVLYRFHALGSEVASWLEKKGIPYEMPAREEGASKAWRIAWHCVMAASGIDQGFHRLALQTQVEKPLFRRMEPLLQEGTPLRRIEEFLVGEGVVSKEEIAPLLKGDPASYPLKFKEEADGLNIQADKVRLLSLHASKGLEFPVVFIIGCDHGIIPWPDGSLEEEKRLLYVGMTRAYRQLYISSSGRKRFMGHTLHGRASPFLQQIKMELKRMERDRAEKRQREKKKGEQLSLF